MPRQFFSSVEKGVHHQLEKGLLAGWPVVDVKVTLTDGKAHSVDSSDVAFQTAAGLALRELASPSTMCLLEPIDTVTVTVDDDYLGAVMTDIGTRRGQIIGSFAAEDQPGRSVLEAAVPQLELLDYAISLRSLAHGTGSFHREHRGYEQLPDRLAKDHVGEKRPARLTTGRGGRAQSAGWARGLVRPVDLQGGGVVGHLVLQRAGRAHVAA